MQRLTSLLGILTAFAVIPAAAAPPPKGETTWWRTSGAAVVEFHHTRCSLLLYNADNAFVFNWQRSGAFLDVEDKAGRFPPARTIPAAVRVGKTWLGQPAHPGQLNLTAIGDRVFRVITVSEPVVPLLATARSITLQLTDAQVSLDVDHAKMPALLRAQKKCLRALG